MAYTKFSTHIEALNEGIRKSLPGTLGFSLTIQPIIQKWWKSVQDNQGALPVEENAFVDFVLKQQTNVKNDLFHEAVRYGMTLAVQQLLRDQDIDINTVDSGYTPLATACIQGHKEVVKQLLKDPRVKVNMGTYPPFVAACQAGYRDVVKLLLADQRSEVNAKSKGGTVFYWACMWRRKDVIAWLLEEPRVTIDNTPPNSGGDTPFHLVYNYHYKDTIEVLLKHPRFDNQWVLPDLQKMVECYKKACFDRDEESACVRSYQAMLGMVKAHIAIPEETWNLLTKEQQKPIDDAEKAYRNQQIAHCFAEIVFLCDGLLQIKPKPEGLEGEAAAQWDRTVRFFKMVRELPMELQMVVCQRAMGSAKNAILKTDSEPAFRWLATAVSSENALQR